MKRDLILAGFVGLIFGICLYISASVLSTLIPILLPQLLLAAVTFGFFLALSVVEIPIMLFGLRHMARSPSTPRRLLVGTFAFFVLFASVYASIFVLLTGQIDWGILLVLLCSARFIAGFWIR